MRYTNLAANGTAVVAPNSCKLKRVVINNQGASSNTLTIYDNASAGSGNVVATIDTTEVKDTLEYGVIMKNGITVVMATGTAADLTIIWE